MPCGPGRRNSAGLAVPAAVAAAVAGGVAGPGSAAGIGLQQERMGREPLLQILPGNPFCPSSCAGACASRRNLRMKPSPPPANRRNPAGNFPRTRRAAGRRRPSARPSPAAGSPPPLPWELEPERPRLPPEQPPPLARILPQRRPSSSWASGWKCGVRAGRVFPPGMYSQVRLFLRSCFVLEKKTPAGCGGRLESDGAGRSREDHQLRMSSFVVLSSPERFVLPSGPADQMSTSGFTAVGLALPSAVLPERK